MKIKKDIIKILPKIGMTSLVGILRDNYPLSFGNYFSFVGGLYCVNMWAENLEEIVKRKKLDTVECTVFSDGKNQLGFITDKRIPKEWLIQDKLCVTGHGWGSRKLCEACLEFAGYSIENHLCGCELPEQQPLIHYTCYVNNPNILYTCSYCKRQWKTDKVWIKSENTK